MKSSNQQYFEDEGKALLVQNHQIQSAEKLVSQLENDLSDLTNKKNDQLCELENLLAECEKELDCRGIDHDDESLKTVDDSLLDSLLKEAQLEVIQKKQYATIDLVNIQNDQGWGTYLSQVEKYADKNNLDLKVDPFNALLSQRDREEIAKRIREDYAMKKAKCDKWDYLIASFSGIATGLIDVFFVGAPGDSALGAWTNEKVDSIVLSFSSCIFKSDQKSGILNDDYYKSMKLPKKCPDTLAGAVSVNIDVVIFDTTYATSFLTRLRISSEGTTYFLVARLPHRCGYFSFADSRIALRFEKIA